MAVTVKRRVDFPMVDMANITYYPRIYDLAHRCFEEAWSEICGVEYATLVTERHLGYPVVDITSTFHGPLRYGRTAVMTMWIESVGTTSVVWQYRLEDDLGQAVWTSRQVTVGVDMRTMEPCTVPEDLREGLLACGPPMEA
ncbi:MAG: acyl-CoA thioesterase [Candidatus Poseidoniaceae archaeon]|nr:MAG: hypothetical protein DWC11_04910 [Candidatus Poseidoniales archaeon]